MSPDLNPLEQVRLEKIHRLRAQGIEPYPARVRRSHTSRQAIRAYEAAETALVAGEAVATQVTLAGRLRSIRMMGKITFAHLEDHEGRVQLFLRSNDIGQDQLELFNREFDLGDFIQASGEVFRTRTGEITLKVTAFHMLAKAITPLPSGKDELVDGQLIQHHSLEDPEVRYRQRYADLAIHPDVRQIFVTRARILRALRGFLDDRGFLEVETPVLQPIYGGAAARPFTTYHNQLKQDLYLRISFELYLKRLTVGLLERVYEIGRDFRNEGVDRLHQPEFTMLEFYWSFADYEQVMALTEEMISFTAQQVLGSPRLTYQGQPVDLTPPWRRLKLADGIFQTSGINITQHPTTESLAAAMRQANISFDPQSPRGKLVDKLISDFLEPSLVQPTFLYDYPREISPLAKSKDGDPNTTERFEGFVAGMELCNAFSELNDPLDQEARFIEMGRAYPADDEERHPLDEDYLRAMRYGMPPQGGFGMGIDRLTMLLTDKANIREVILFPHLRKEEA
jgi:lysyl-tRNA synthetase, class II